MNKKIASIAVIAVLLLSTLPFFASTSDADSSNEVLIDYGNGQIKWTTSTTTGTVGDAVKDALSKSGISYSDDLTTINGVSTVTIGSDDTGGSFVNSGTTGVKVTSYWQVYSWDAGNSKWAVTTTTSIINSTIAVGHYPAGTTPTSTPDCKAVWTMIAVDSLNSGDQTAEISTTLGKIVKEDFPTADVNGAYAATLYAKHLAIVKFGQSNEKDPSGSPYYHSRIVCYNTTDWSQKWVFTYPTSMLETTTPLIAGDYVYVQAMQKYNIADGSCIYRVPLVDGPGTDNANVTTFNGEKWDSTTTIPEKTITVTTDASGNYSTVALDPGTYKITARAKGYLSHIATITVEAGHKAVIDFQIKEKGETGTATHTEDYPSSASTVICGKVTDLNSGDPVEGVTLLIEHVLEGGSQYGYGPGSLVYDSGVIFCKCSNGMVYAFDTNLNLLWSHQTNATSYFYSVTVAYGMVFAGMGDGYLHVLDERTGKEIASQQVCHKSEDAPGLVNPPAVIKRSDGTYDVYVTFATGGMGSTYNGRGVYNLSGTTFTEVVKPEPTTSSVSPYLTHYSGDGVTGVIMFYGDDLVTYVRDSSGSMSGKTITNYFKESLCSHAQPTLVNGNTLYVSTYAAGTAGAADAQSVYAVDLNGSILGRMTPNTLNYCMCPVTVVDGYIFCGNDAGVYFYQGAMAEYHPPVNNSTPVWQTLLYVLAGIIIVLAAFWTVLRFGLKWEHPFADLKVHVMTYFYGENYTHNTKSKRKLRMVILFGLVLTFGAAIASLCIGSHNTVGVGDALSALVSSIQKGGHHLNTIEMLIYNQRLPRVLATIAVGVGLSIAGAVYQAVIKNPLVEPYIMGVSSGAGTLAIAVITFGFTFFGLFSPQSPFLTATAAIVGGLLAFGLTMLLAMKTGGKSINFVLAGIIIGLVFSAIQSVMMIGAGTKTANALSWLYGSFINISWETVWIIVIPCIMLSLIPLVWAKELNLVLLGEDQAMQMGLNAKKFDAVMLIIVSVLTAFCVAFCGIIGFVGLVIPHLARLLLGGDHRLMLPISMAFGGFLLVTADLLSRVLVTGYELPVGAITAVIGVPVFAYLLIRRGRSYDG